MRRIIISEFVSLDGVMEAPHEWHFPFWNEEMARFKTDELFASDAMLLGRDTYEGFAAAWPTQEHADMVNEKTSQDGAATLDENAFSRRMNTMAKYVVSTTLKQATWKNSHIISRDVAREIARLKQESGQDIVVHGSATLARWLLDQKLVDEIRLLVHPIVVGKGKRLFVDADRTTLKLVESTTFQTGVLAVRYAPA